MKQKKLFKQLAIAVPTLFIASQAFAFKPFYCGSTPERWPNNTYTINADRTGFPQNGKWWNALRKAMDRVNQNPSNFYMNMRAENDSLVGVQNGESEVWWSNDPAHSPAIAYTIDNCGTIVEGDVIFYNQINYGDQMSNKSNFWGYGGNQRPFETTAVHELGHTAGLNHENREYNIMGTDYQHVHANGSTLRSYLGEDAADGLVWLYGTRAGQDVSVAHWKYNGSSGAYSSHAYTKMYSSSGAVLSSSPVSSSCTNANTCERRYNVDAGQNVQFEVTVENNGRSSQTRNIGFYISTNDTITTSDTLIKSRSITVHRGNVDTIKESITIPSNLNPNTNYWVGAIIDYDNGISEMTEDNNATYTAIRTSSTTGGGNNTSGVPDACASESAITGGSLSDGDAACLASQSTIWLSVANVSGHNSIAITTGNGSTGDLDIEYSNSGWPSGSNVDGSSTGNDNNECIYITGGSNYWGYIKVSDSTGGSSIVVDFDTAGCR